MTESPLSSKINSLIDSEVFSTPFHKQFIFNIDMLNYRISRLQKIDTIDRGNQAEYLMVFDATLTLFRAMLLERQKENYTFQNYFRKTNRKDIADQIDAFLDLPFASYMDKSIRDVLKFIADKFICHVDKVEKSDIGLCNAWMSNLSNPYFDNNFKHIVNTLNGIINSAFEQRT